MRHTLFGWLSICNTIETEKSYNRTTFFCNKKRAEARFLYNNPYFYLFRTTQDTIFFVFVVDSLAGIAALGSEIEVAMKVENEHLAEIPHLGVLRVRSKSGEVFGLDAIALDRERVHQHRTEAPC